MALEVNGHDLHIAERKPCSTGLGKHVIIAWSI